MLLLGVLAAQAEAAAPPAGAGAYDLLETEILTGTQASVTFSSLNSTYGSTYQHLQIRMTGRGTANDTDSYLYITLNGDTGANYKAHQLWAHGTGGVDANAFIYGGLGLIIAGITANNATADAFGANVIDFLDAFETTKNKTVRSFGGEHGGYNKVGLESFAWFNTAALTSIKVAPSAGSFVTGSRLSLYGLKG